MIHDPTIKQEDLNKAIKIVNYFDAFVPMERLSHPNVRELLNKNVSEYLEGLRIFERATAIKPRHSTSPIVQSRQKVSRSNHKRKWVWYLLYSYVLDKLGIS